MVKKLVTIDVNDKNLTESTTSAKAKTANSKEATEIEKLGFVEINSGKSANKSSTTKTKGFEKNVSESVKKSVKQKTSMVEDYFDFSFRVNEKNSETKDVAVAKKTVKAKSASKTTTKTSAKSAKKVDKVKELEIKVDESLKNEQNSILTATVTFDNEANQIIRVARIGSLFDCDKRIIQA